MRKKSYSIPIGVRLDEDDLGVIKSFAQKQGIGVSSMIRTIVRQWCSDREYCPECGSMWVNGKCSSPNKH